MLSAIARDRARPNGHPVFGAEYNRQFIRRWITEISVAGGHGFGR